MGTLLSLQDLLVGIPPYVYFLIALAAVIAYRFIPASKQMTPFFGLTIKQVGEPDISWPVRTVMIVLVSLCVLGASLYIILSRKYDDSSQKWAYGAVGTIAGHWLKR